MIRRKKTLVGCLAVATVICWLPGCEDRRNDLSRPLRVGQEVFPSHEAYLQNRPERCSTSPPPANERVAVEESLKSFEQTASQERAAGSVTIPVIFHVISSAGEGDVPKEALEHQIRVLNDAFSGRDPRAPGVQTPFRFELADIDRRQNDAWFNMEFREEPTEAERAAKTELNRGGKSTLNIYTIKVVSKPFGWARWPWDFAKGVDGVVIGYRTLPGGGEVFYDEGDTATHEVGHWLGLFHTFERGCDGLGDEVEDTPAEVGPTRFCPDQVDSCPSQSGPDSIDNFMNYTYDRCMFTFTPGQSRRMDLMHQQHRTESDLEGRR